MEYNIDNKIKKNILIMWYEGTIKLGQKIPITTWEGSLNSTDKEIENSTQYQEITITEKFIQRLRTEQRLTGDEK